MERESKLNRFPAPYDEEIGILRCPVCDNVLEENSLYALELGPRGNQKLFACSKDHIEKVRYDTKTYFAQGSNASDGGFCTGGSAMFNGFDFSAGNTCTLLLFKVWVLDTRFKYAIGFIGVLFVSILLELWGEIRESAQTQLVQCFGYTVNGAKTERLFSAHMQDSDITDPLYVNQVQSDGLISTKKRIPAWCQAILVGLYMIHIALAYLIMLVVMRYVFILAPPSSQCCSFEIGLFTAVVLGLGIGFFLFKDTEGENMSKNIDPCCST